MMIVSVHLASAVDGRMQQLARMHISNDGQATLQNPRLGDYVGETFVGRDAEALAQGRVAKRGEVRSWRRHDFHVWNLVARMLEAMGYDKGRSRTAFADLPLVDGPAEIPDVEILGEVDLCERVEAHVKAILAMDWDAARGAGLTDHQAFTGLSGGLLGSLLGLAWRARAPGTTIEQLADHLHAGMLQILPLVASEAEAPSGSSADA